MNVSTNTTRQSSPRPTRSQVIFIVQMTSLAVLGAVIILGNLASVVTFVKTQSLRRRSHYLIICLSVADLLVGVVAFMLLYYFLTGPKINAYAFTLEFLDTLTGMASVLTLSAISVERFSAIVFPFRHRRLRFRVYVVLSASPWILATGLAVISLIGHYYRNVYYQFLHVSFAIIALALMTISVSYISMGCKMKRQENVGAQNQNRALRDKRLVVTLLIVTLCSLLTWMPLQGYIIVKNLCKKCPLPDTDDIFIMKFFQFCNSGFNIFIYMVRMTEFRVAFLALFCRRDRRTSMERSRNNTVNQTNRALATDEDTQFPRSTNGEITEFDDLRGKEQVFVRPSINCIINNNNNTNFKNKETQPSHANNNVQKNLNDERGNSFGKTILEENGVPMDQHHDESTQGTKEHDPARPAAHLRNFSTSKHRVALDRIEEYDTPM